MGPSTGLGLHCLDESDGSIIWDNPMGGSGGVSTPAVAGGMVFAGDYLGDLYCIDATTGITKWNMSVEPNPAWWGLASSPLIYDGMVYVVSWSDGTMHAIDFDGVEQWNYSASGASDMYMSVATDGSKLFFGGGNATNCVDIATQTTAWTFTVDDKVTTTPAACDGVVYFATGKNEKKLYAVDIATGNEVWSRSLYGSLSSPAISDGKIYIGDKDQQINCIDASDGSRCGRHGVHHSQLWGRYGLLFRCRRRHAGLELRYQPVQHGTARHIGRDPLRGIGLRVSVCV
jgi:cobaltochelatase CobN